MLMKKMKKTAFNRYTTLRKDEVVANSVITCHNVDRIQPSSSVAELAAVERGTAEETSEEPTAEPTE